MKSGLKIVSITGVRRKNLKLINILRVEELDSSDQECDLSDQVTHLPISLQFKGQSVEDQSCPHFTQTILKQCLSYKLQLMIVDLFQ